MATGGVLSPSSREIWHQRWRRRRRQDLVFKPSVEDARILPDSTGRLDDEIGSQNVLDFFFQEGFVFLDNKYFFWGGGGSNDFAGPNKFTDPTNFWIQFVFECKHFLDPTCFFGSEQSFGSKKVLEPKHSRIFGSQHFNQGIFANLRHSVWALVVVVVSVVVVVVVSVVVVVVVVMWANGP